MRQRSQMQAIKDVLAQEGGEVQAKNKVILATVKGDIHDIGKNIVKSPLRITVLM